MPWPQHIDAKAEYKFRKFRINKYFTPLDIKNPEEYGSRISNRVVFDSSSSCTEIISYDSVLFFMMMVACFQVL